MIQDAIARAVQREALTRELARASMEQVLTGEATPAQIGALAVALRMKGETPDEIAGMAEAVRRRVPPIRSRRSPLLDTCGTGGDNVEPEDSVHAALLDLVLGRAFRPVAVSVQLSMLTTRTI